MAKTRAEEAPGAAERPQDEPEAATGATTHLESAAPPVVLHYVGDGSALDDIPARDLTAAELAALVAHPLLAERWPTAEALQAFLVDFAEGTLYRAA